MPDYTISGVATHPDMGADLVGFWNIDRYPACGCTPLEDLADNLEMPLSVYAPGAGRPAEATLEGTVGDQLYWMEFTSSDRSTRLGPFLFTLTTDRTWDEIMDNPAPMPSGGGSDPSLRGTLYLKATVTNADASTEEWADGSGSPFALVLDTERQGSLPIPSWANEASPGVYEIAQTGGYLAQIAGVGTVTYDVEPASVYVDMYHAILAGVNFGWNSDGSDDSDPFPVDVVTELPFGQKDSGQLSQVSGGDLPVSLAGLVGDNYGPVTDNPRVSLDVLFSVTKYASGPLYTEADLT